MTITFTDDDLVVLAHIRRAGGYTSDEDTIMGALWNFAGFLGVDVHPDLFALAVKVRRTGTDHDPVVSSPRRRRPRARAK